MLPRKYLLDLGQLVGRDRKLAHRHAVGGRQHDLLLGARRIVAPDAGSARWWHRRVRRHGDSRTTDSSPGRRSPTVRRARPARSKAWARRQMSFICWRWMCMPLTNTASAHSKSSLVAGRRFSSMKRTGQFAGQIGRDQQQALRRHEGLDAVGQRIGMFEGAERRRVARKDAEDAPDRLNAFSSHQTSSAQSRNAN